MSHNQLIKTILYDISTQAKQAILNINHRADVLLIDIEEEHYARMCRLDWQESEKAKEKAIHDWLSKFDGTIDCWWDSLDDGQQRYWEGWYDQYMLSPFGDCIFAENDYVAWAIMNYLYKQFVEF